MPNVPHEPAGAQLQLTPPFAESFATVAATDAVPPVGRLAGGAVVMDTEIPEPAVIVIVAVADFDVSATEVAVTITVLPVGIVEGAV